LAHPVPARLSTDYTAAKGRKFGFTVGLAFGVLSAVAWWREAPRVFVVLASLGAVLITAALVAPRALRTVEHAWMKLALLISKVTTPVFMGVIYYVVLTPVGALRRAAGRNSLVHRAGPHGHWADRSTTPRSSLDRLF
jgi:hypothetical protein